MRGLGAPSLAQGGGGPTPAQGSLFRGWVPSGDHRCGCWGSGNGAHSGQPRRVPLRAKPSSRLPGGQKALAAEPSHLSVPVTQEPVTRELGHRRLPGWCHGLSCWEAELPESWPRVPGAQVLPGSWEGSKALRSVWSPRASWGSGVKRDQDAPPCLPACSWDWGGGRRARPDLGEPIAAYRRAPGTRAELWVGRRHGFQVRGGRAAPWGRGRHPAEHPRLCPLQGLRETPGDHLVLECGGTQHWLGCRRPPGGLQDPEPSPTLQGLGFGRQCGGQWGMAETGSHACCALLALSCGASPAALQTRPVPPELRQPALPQGSPAGLASHSHMEQCTRVRSSPAESPRKARVQRSPPRVGTSSLWQSADTPHKKRLGPRSQTQPATPRAGARGTLEVW